MIELKHVARWCTLAGALIAGTVAAAPVVLRASHQFPGGKGDVRDDMVQMIARDAKAANVGLDVQVYPGASLFKPNQQWNAIVEGQLDITLFPLDYASGKVRAFGTRGSSPGKFNVVSGIAADDNGNIYVADTLRCVVMIFDREFNFRTEFGYRGLEPGNLIAPMELTVDSDRVYVAQTRSRGVSVFRVFTN